MHPPSPLVPRWSVRRQQGTEREPTPRHTARLAPGRVGPFRRYHFVLRGSEKPFFMPTLDAGTRARLPDSSFAYIDSQGRRRLPINDAAHVRNALARFNQVAFEDEAARDRARTRLLRAAQKHGIMPIGFVRAQL